MKARSYFKWFLALALVGFAVDQVSKYVVFSWLSGNGQGGRHEHELVPGTFRFSTAYTDHPAATADFRSPLRTLSSDRLPQVNSGGLFGLGGNKEMPDQNHRTNQRFALVSAIAAAAILFWATRRSAKPDGLLCTALGLILAGTLGNLYDRMIFDGVRDFLDFYIIRWPVFNIADCCLVVGAGLLLGQAFLSKPAAAPDNTSKAAVISTGVDG